MIGVELPVPYCSRCGSNLEGWFCIRCGTGFIQADLDLVSAAAEELKDRFVQAFYPLDGHLHLHDAALVFLEAARCCIHQEYLATAAMSRVAVESALYSARTTRFEADRVIVEAPVLSLLPDIRFDVYRQLEWAIRSRLLDRETATKIRKAREIGNFAAHFAETIMRHEAAHPERIHQLWVTPEDAYLTLQLASRVLLQIADRIPTAATH